MPDIPGVLVVAPKAFGVAVAVFVVEQQAATHRIDYAVDVDRFRLTCFHVVLK